MKRISIEKKSLTSFIIFNIKKNNSQNLKKGKKIMETKLKLSSIDQSIERFEMMVVLMLFVVFIRHEIFMFFFILLMNLSVKRGA